MKKTKYFLQSYILEAVTQSRSTAKVLLKRSQKSQENIRVESQAGSFQTSLKRDFYADIFTVNVEKFSK